jgi:hypothetical protein
LATAVEAQSLVVEVGRRTKKQFGDFIELCCFISFSSLLIGFWPGINDVGMGFTTYQ